MKNMYDEAKNRVIIVRGDSKQFSVEMGLHLGSSLISPFLFVLVIGELKRHI